MVGGRTTRRGYLSPLEIIDGAGVTALYLLVLYWMLDDLLK